LRILIGLVVWVAAEMLMFGRVYSLSLRLSTRLCISSRSNKNIQQGTVTTMYHIVHLMAQLAMHALKSLVCHALSTPATSRASHREQCSALALLSLHARGYVSLFTSTSGAECGEAIIMCMPRVQTLGIPRYRHLHSSESGTVSPARQSDM
jgi:hypothetical protein